MAVTRRPALPLSYAAKSCSPTKLELSPGWPGCGPTARLSQAASHGVPIPRRRRPFQAVPAVLAPGRRSLRPRGPARRRPRRQLAHFRNSSRHGGSRLGRAAASESGARQRAPNPGPGPAAPAGCPADPAADLERPFKSSWAAAEGSRPGNMYLNDIPSPVARARWPRYWQAQPEARPGLRYYSNCDGRPPAS